MYAYFKKLDYFSTECIYSPNAYRLVNLKQYEGPFDTMPLRRSPSLNNICPCKQQGARARVSQGSGDHPPQHHHRFGAKGGGGGGGGGTCASSHDILAI